MNVMPQTSGMDQDLEWLKKFLENTSSVVVTTLARYLGIYEEIEQRIPRNLKKDLIKRIYEWIKGVDEESDAVRNMKKQRICHILAFYLDLGGKRLIAKSRLLQSVYIWLQNIPIPYERLSIDGIVALLISNEKASIEEICHALAEASIEGADPRVRYSEEIEGDISPDFTLPSLKQRSRREKVRREINEELKRKIQGLSARLHANVNLGILVHNKRNEILFTIVLEDRYARQLRYRETDVGAQLVSEIVRLGKIRVIKVEYLSDRKIRCTTNLNLNRRRDRHVWEIIIGKIIRKEKTHRLEITDLSHKLLRGLTKQICEHIKKGNVAESYNIFMNFVEDLRKNMKKCIKEYKINDELKQRVITFVDSLEISKIEIQYGKYVEKFSIRISEPIKEALIGVAYAIVASKPAKRTRMELELRGTFPTALGRKRICYISILSEGIKVPKGLTHEVCDLLQKALEYAVKKLCEKYGQ